MILILRRLPSEGSMENQGGVIVPRRKALSLCLHFTVLFFKATFKFTYYLRLRISQGPRYSLCLRDSLWCLHRNATGDECTAQEAEFVVQLHWRTSSAVGNVSGSMMGFQGECYEESLFARLARHMLRSRVSLKVVREMGGDVKIVG